MSLLLIYFFWQDIFNFSYNAISNHYFIFADEQYTYSEHFVIGVKEDDG